MRERRREMDDLWVGCAAGGSGDRVDAARPWGDYVDVMGGADIYGHTVNLVSVSPMRRARASSLPPPI